MSKTSRLGLVLSGGGSRAIAQIGVMRALIQHGVTVDCIAGCSAGAIIGALFSAGYSPAEMLQFFETKNPFQVSKVTFKKPGFIDTTKIVADFEEYFPDNAFEALKIPLRIAATDMLKSRAAAFDSGPLIPAILASSAVPMIFTPVEIDGHWYSDGGIVSTFPIELVEDRCRVLLGVQCAPRREIRRSDLGSSLSVIHRALEVGMYNNSHEKYKRCHVLIQPQGLQDFGFFDSKNHKDIERIGYDATCAALPKLEQALEAS